jgi:hypothetical protein
VLQILIGTDTESLLLLLLAGTLADVIVVERNYAPLGSLVWLLAIVIGLYFLRNIVTAIIRLVEAIRGSGYS